MAEERHLRGVGVGEAALEEPGRGAPVLVTGSRDFGGEELLAGGNRLLGVVQKLAIGAGLGLPPALQPQHQEGLGDPAGGGRGSEGAARSAQGLEDSLETVWGELGGASHGTGERGAG